jgi:hypothetical protein
VVRYADRRSSFTFGRIEHGSGAKKAGSALNESEATAVESKLASSLTDTAVGLDPCSEGE